MTPFLRRLFKALSGWVSEFSRADPVAPDEALTRYLFESSKFKRSDGTVRPKAFLPDPYMETSVFRITGILEPGVWRIGNKIRAAPAVARADVIASAVFDVRLQVVPETSKYENHAVIIGWPSAKHERMMKATLLANAATLHFPPTQS